MNTLGNIQLPNALEWTGAMQSSGVSTVHRMALDGSLVTFSGPDIGTIILTAGDDYGWIAAETAFALVALSVSTMSTTLTWAGEVIPVRFDHADGPAVNLSPLYPGALWYSGTLSLIREP